MSFIQTNIKNMLLVIIYGYKLACVHDKYSQLFTSSLGEDAVYNFINSMIEESKYCGDVM